MSKPKYGVVAIGNALVDVLSHVSDDFLNQQAAAHKIEKGTMALIDEERAVELYDQLSGRTETSGGSAANTMAGFASMGGQGGFIAKVADDTLGQTFKTDLQSLGLEYTTQPLAIGAPTGRCMIMITPDAQRTMNTFLGASTEINEVDVDAELITNAQITYLEGYLFDKDTAKHAFILAAETAHNAGHRIALTLSDPFCVDRHRSDFLRLVESHVDILFANEEEIKSLFMQDNFEDAANAVSQHVEVAVLTRGDKGAIIRGRGETVAIPAFPVKTVIDTTGAGDQFAAGFLYGFTEGLPLETCGKLGALAAAEVISHTGPRPATNLKELAIAHGLIET